MRVLKLRRDAGEQDVRITGIEDHKGGAGLARTAGRVGKSTRTRSPA